jgi:hypothetical protein
MYVTPVRLSEEEQEFAVLMSEPPTPHSEALAFARALDQAEKE